MHFRMQFSLKDWIFVGSDAKRSPDDEHLVRLRYGLSRELFSFKRYLTEAGRSEELQESFNVR